jgi:hypothetical protein
MNEDRDEEVSQDDVIGQKLRDAETPGYEVAFDPDEAERIAFHEDALSDQDARDSVTDLRQEKDAWIQVISRGDWQTS